jgi:hypothetical protein
MEQRIAMVVAGILVLLAAAWLVVRCSTHHGTPARLVEVPSVSGTAVLLPAPVLPPLLPPPSRTVAYVPLSRMNARQFVRATTPPKPHLVHHHAPTDLAQLHGFTGLWAAAPGLCADAWWHVGGRVITSADNATACELNHLRSAGGVSATLNLNCSIGAHYRGREVWILNKPQPDTLMVRADVTNPGSDATAVRLHRCVIRPAQQMAED